MLTIVLLHGHGDEPATLEPAARALGDRLGALVVVPRGPVACPGGGFAWWPEGAAGPDPGAGAEVAARVRGAQRVVVGGFSQGAAAALAFGLGDAVVSVAGFLVEGAPSAAHRPAVLVVHGEADDVVDPLHGRMVARRCRAEGCEVTERWHGGGHVWDETVTAAVAEWLSA